LIDLTRRFRGSLES